MQARGRIPLSDQGFVTEKFSRVSPQEIHYEFEVNDPVNYTQVWKGESTFRISKEKIFEYACHEGNYALPGILRGMAEGARHRHRPGRRISEPGPRLALLGAGFILFRAFKSRAKSPRFAWLCFMAGSTGPAEANRFPGVEA